MAECRDSNTCCEDTGRRVKASTKFKVNAFLLLASEETREKNKKTKKKMLNQRTLRIEQMFNVFKTLSTPHTFIKKGCQTPVPIKPEQEPLFPTVLFIKHSTCEHFSHDQRAPTLTKLPPSLFPSSILASLPLPSFPYSV